MNPRSSLYGSKATLGGFPSSSSGGLGSGGMVSSGGSSGKDRLLQARIAAKEAELASLQQLKAQADMLLASVEALESQFGTLNQGTEAVASVLANWANVFKAINISNAGLQRQSNEEAQEEHQDQQEREEDEAPGRTTKEKKDIMPETLVRIPIKRD